MTRLLIVDDHPGWLIMDQLMPCMGGVEATRAIKDAGCSYRVLMLSANWTQDQVRKSCSSLSGAFGRVPHR